MTEAASIYGKSLYDLAAEENLTEEIADEMESVRGIFRDNPDYITLLSEPSVKKQERLKLLDEAFGDSIHPYLLNFLKVLLEKEMLREYGACCRKVRELYNKDHGITEAAVVSAVALSGEQADQLREKLESVSGKKVILKQKTDPAVLGGIRVEMDGKLYDGTVRGRLTDLRKKVGETVI